MNEASTSITYSGEALGRGMMEVRDFAPSIEAFAKTCQQSYTVLTGRKDNISVAINSDFKKGSFEVVLTISLQLSVEITAQELLGYIYEIYEAYRKTKGRPVKHVEQSVRSFLYERTEKREIDVGIAQGKLVASHSSWQFYRNFVTPLLNKDIEEISFKNEILKITKSDIEFIDDSTICDIDSIYDIDSIRQVMLVEVITPQLEGNRKWRFTLGGRDSFSAYVTDGKFLSKVRRGEIDFRRGDKFLVERLTSQSIKEDYLKANHTIAEVIARVKSD